jgi:hypothetical protein
MIILLIVFLATGSLLVGLSIPLILQRIPPNQWYGFRIPANLNDPEIWYLVNAYAALRTLWLGIVQIIVSIAIYFTPGVNVDAYGSIVGAVLVFGMIISIAQSFRCLSRLTKEETGNKNIEDFRAG